MILDGAQALHKATRAVFGEAALIQRCQVHKLCNILDHLPERQRPWVQAIVRRAYLAADVKTATRLLTNLATGLDDDYPSAASSVREGLDETLTVLTLHLSARLQRSLATTNAVESLLSRTRHVKRHEKRWRGGQMLLRWVAAGGLEDVKGFWRLKGCGDMPRLVSALRARDQRLALGVAEVNVAWNLTRAAAEFQQRTGHPLELFERRPETKCPLVSSAQWQASAAAARDSTSRRRLQPVLGRPLSVRFKARTAANLGIPLQLQQPPPCAGRQHGIGPR